MSQMTTEPVSESETSSNAEPASAQPTLARQIGFTPEDLEANRSGRLSDMQDYRLRVRRWRSIAIGGAFVLLAAFIATLLIFVGTREGGSPILLIIGIGVTICNAALVGMFARNWLRLSADIREGRVIASSGVLERVIKPVSGRVMQYMIRVDDTEVMVNKAMFEAFDHRQPYILYRAPYSGTLLSAERENGSKG
jgi:hypothetical protein